MTRRNESVSSGQSMFGPVTAMEALHSQRRENLSLRAEAVHLLDDNQANVDGDGARVVLLSHGLVS